MPLMERKNEWMLTYNPLPPKKQQQQQQQKTACVKFEKREHPPLPVM